MNGRFPQEYGRRDYRMSSLSFLQSDCLLMIKLGVVVQCVHRIDRI